MRAHWKVLLWMLGGLVVGLLFQAYLEAPAWSGATWRAGEGGLRLVAADGPAAKASLDPGAAYDRLILDRGEEDETVLPLAAPADLEQALATRENGEVVPCD